MRLFYTAIFAVLAGTAGADQFQIRSDVRHVTFMAQGGIITRTAALNLPAGQHKITVLGLPANLEPTGFSLKLENAPDAQITATQFIQTRKQPIPREFSEQERQMQAHLDLAVKNLQAHQALMSQSKAIASAAQLQLKFLGSVADGSSSALSLESVSGPEVLSELTQNIGQEVARAIKAETEGRHQLALLTRQENELRAEVEQAQEALNAVTPTERDELQVVLDVQAGAPINGRVSIEYISDQVFWNPYYRVNVAQTQDQGDITIQRSALIVQQTYEDWGDVNVTLSTANLNERMQMYMPRPQTPRIFNPDDRRNLYSKSSGSVNADFNSIAEPMMEELSSAPANSGAQLLGQTVVFNVPSSISLKSGGDAVLVPLDEIQTQKQLYARSSANEKGQSFLMVDMENTTAGRIIRGNAAVFRDGAFVGDITMPDSVAGDEYSLALGVLDGLIVQQEVIEREDGDKGILSSQQTAKYAYRTEVKSLLSYDIALHLYDTIPQSTQEDLVISDYAKPAITVRDADRTKGLMIWELDVPAQSVQSVDFGYQMRWPSGMQLE